MITTRIKAPEKTFFTDAEFRALSNALVTEINKGKLKVFDENMGQAIVNLASATSVQEAEQVLRSNKTIASQVPQLLTGLQLTEIFKTLTVPGLSKSTLKVDAKRQLLQSYLETHSSQEALKVAVQDLSRIKEEKKVYQATKKSPTKVIDVLTGLEVKKVSKKVAVNVKNLPLGMNVAVKDEEIVRAFELIVSKGVSGEYTDEENILLGKFFVDGQQFVDIVSVASMNNAIFAPVLEKMIALAGLTYVSLKQTKKTEMTLEEDAHVVDLAIKISRVFKSGLVKLVTKVLRASMYKVSVKTGKKIVESDPYRKLGHIARLHLKMAAGRTSRYDIKTNAVVSELTFVTYLLSFFKRFMSEAKLQGEKDTIQKYVDKKAETWNKILALYYTSDGTLKGVKISELEPAKKILGYFQDKLKEFGLFNEEEFILSEEMRDVQIQRQIEGKPGLKFSPKALGESALSRRSGRQLGAPELRFSNVGELFKSGAELYNTPQGQAFRNRQTLTGSQEDKYLKVKQGLSGVGVEDLLAFSELLCTERSKDLTDSERRELSSAMRTYVGLDQNASMEQICNNLSYYRLVLLLNREMPDYNFSSIFRGEVNLSTQDRSVVKAGLQELGVGGALDSDYDQLVQAMSTQPEQFLLMITGEQPFIAPKEMKVSPFKPKDLKSTKPAVRVTSIYSPLAQKTTQPILKFGLQKTSPVTQIIQPIQQEIKFSPTKQTFGLGTQPTFQVQQTTPSFGIGQTTERVQQIAPSKLSGIQGLLKKKL